MRIKIILIITNILLVLTLLNTISVNKYDVNKDGKVNANDYIEIKNYIMRGDK